MGQLILARAGSTEFDEQGRIVGTLNVPLSLRGEAEIVELARELRAVEVEAIYTSGGLSAEMSGKLLGQELDVKVRTIDDLTNLDFGLWQGLQIEEVRRKHPKVYKQWEESPCLVCPPAGEMLEQVVERVHRLIKPVLRKAQSGPVVLVAPEPLRRVIRCELTKADPCHLFEQAEGPNWERLGIA